MNVRFLRYAFLVILCLWSAIDGHAQKPLSVPDSLFAQIKAGKEDTNYIRAVNEYIWWLLNPLDDVKSADSLIQKAEIVAKRLRDQIGLERVYVNSARVKMRGGDHFLALKYAQFAQQTAGKIKLSPVEQQRMLSVLGQAYFYTNQVEQALKYYLAAIRLTEKYNITDYSTRAYIGVNEVLLTMGRRQEAFFYVKRAIKMAYKDHDKTMIVWAEMLYGGNLEQQGKSDLAISHFNKAVQYANLYSNVTQKVSVWQAVALHYRNEEQYDDAFKYLQLIEQQVTENSNPGIIMSACYAFSAYYRKTGNPKLAEAYLKRGLETARKTKFFQAQVNFLQGLTGLYDDTQQYKKAFEHQLLLEQVKDSLFSNQLTIKTRDLITKYESRKTEDQIRLLNEERKNDRFQRNAILAGIVLLLLLAGALIAWLINRAKVERLKQVQNLRQQIANDLHDEVGSTLSSISLLSGVADKLLDQSHKLVTIGGIENGTDGPYEPAQKIIRKIYTDTRQILESVDEIIWTIHPSDHSSYNLIQKLRDYTMPLMESKGIACTFHYDPVPDHQVLSMEVRRNVYLIGKEAVNNLLKHSGASEASVSFSAKHKLLRLTVTDNGRGFDPKQSSTRNGQRSIRQRVETMGATLEINSVPGQGTVVGISLNIG